MTEPSALTREQIEEVIEGGDAETFLAHDAAQRARVAELEHQVEAGARNYESAVKGRQEFRSEVVSLRQQLAEARKEREALRLERDEMRYRLQTWIDAHADNPALEPPAPPAADTGERP